MELGINIDHVASVRELRRSRYPDPVEAARVCEEAGADSIVAHLREDRRHINDRDVLRLRKAVTTKLNLEMSANKSIVDIACKIRPDQATLVPEKRQELTTEGGLNIILYRNKVKMVTERLHSKGILVSLFIEPRIKHIDASKDIGADCIEIHTGGYANSRNSAERKKSLSAIRSAVKHADSLGLRVNAGHGLDYKNVVSICKISEIKELNIGYSVICHSLMVGLSQAVKQMRRAIIVSVGHL